MGDELNAEAVSGEFTDWWRKSGESELRQLLYWVWDPIGVAEEFPAALGEYDRYGIEIATALASGMPVSALAALLTAIERDRMGLGQRSLDTVADRLHVWYRRSRGRSPAPDLMSSALACSQIR